MDDNRVIIAPDAYYVPGALGESYVYKNGRQIGCVLTVVTDYPGITKFQKDHPYRARFYTTYRFTDLKQSFHTVREAALAVVKYSRTHKVNRFV